VNNFSAESKHLTRRNAPESLVVSINPQISEKRAAKGAAKVLGADDRNTREYVKFFEILENGQPLMIPYMKFRETFLSGNQT